MRSRLLPLALLLAVAAPARTAAADDGAAIKRNATAPIAGTPLPNWSWPEPKVEKKAKSPGLVIAGGIVGGLGAAGAIAGLVLMGAARSGCPNFRDNEGNILTLPAPVDRDDPTKGMVDVARSQCPGPTLTTGHDIGTTVLLGSAALAAAGLTMVLVGIQPAEDEAPTTATRLVPTVTISPTGGVLTWRF